MSKHSEICFINFGPAGCGKGTTSHELLKPQHFGDDASVFEAGNIFRSLDPNESETSRKIFELMNKRELVGDELTNELMLPKIKEMLHNSRFTILDGYPRTVKQAKDLISLFKNHFNTTMVVPVYFEIDLKTCIKRALSRKRHDDSEEKIIAAYTRFVAFEIPAFLATQEEFGDNSIGLDAKRSTTELAEALVQHVEKLMSAAA